MATRRYRKRSKKSLKKRVSRRRKNVRSSRRMRGGTIECKEQSFGPCKYELKTGNLYEDTTSTEPLNYRLYKFVDITEDSGIVYNFIRVENKENKTYRFDNNTHQNFLKNLIDYSASDDTIVGAAAGY